MKKLSEEVSIDLGDVRLNKRYEKVVAARLKNPSKSIPNMAQDWHETKAIYRFFANEKVTAAKILDYLHRRTMGDLEVFDDEDVLILQDTAHLHYAGDEKQGGSVGARVYMRTGMDIHPSLAVTAGGVHVGLLQVLLLTGDKVGKADVEQASCRWLSSWRMSQEVAGKVPSKRFFNVADVDCAMCDVVVDAAQGDVDNVYCIVGLSSGDKGCRGGARVKRAIDGGVVLGEVAFTYKSGKEARVVRQCVQVGKMSLSGFGKGRGVGRRDVWVIRASERNAPAGVSGLEWVVGTNYAIGCLEDAKKILSYYTRGWDLDVFFTVLRRGCEVEELRLATLDRLEPCLALYMSVACSMMSALQAGQTYPNLDADVLCSSAGWRVVE